MKAMLFALLLSTIAFAEHDVTKPGQARAIDPSSHRYLTLRMHALDLLRAQRYADACNVIAQINEYPYPWACDENGWRHQPSRFIDELQTNPAFNKDALEFCRAQTSNASATALRAAVAEHADVPQLVALIERHPLTQAAMEGLVLLASITLERGDYALAAILFDRLQKDWKFIEDKLETRRALPPRTLYRIATAKKRAHWPQAEVDALMAELERAIPEGLQIGRRTWPIAALRQELARTVEPLAPLSAEMMSFLDANHTVHAPQTLPTKETSSFVSGPPAKLHHWQREIPAQPPVSPRLLELALQLNPVPTQRLVREAWVAARLQNPQHNWDPEENIACAAETRIAGGILDPVRLYDADNAAARRFARWAPAGIILRRPRNDAFDTVIPSLLEVETTGAKIPQSMIDGIARQPDLRRLHLQANLTGVTLAPLRTLQKLTTLYVDHALSTEEMAHVGAITPLRTLQLSHSTDEGVAALAPLTNLRELRIANGSLRGTGFSAWPAPGSLRALELTRSAVNGEGLTQIARFTGLEELDLTLVSLRPGDAARLAPLRELRRLNLSRNRLRAADIRSLATLTRLEELRLAYCELDDAAVAELARLPRLQHLSVAGNQLTDRAYDSLARIRGLRSLTLYGNPQTWQGLEKLKDLEHLEHLSLGYTSSEVTPEFLQKLSEFTRLRELDLGNLRLSPAQRQRLEQSLPNTRIS